MHTTDQTETQAEDEWSTFTPDGVLGKREQVNVDESENIKITEDTNNSNNSSINNVTTDTELNTADQSLPKTTEDTQSNINASDNTAYVHDTIEDNVVVDEQYSDNIPVAPPPPPIVGIQ